MVSIASPNVVPGYNAAFANVPTGNNPLQDYLSQILGGNSGDSATPSVYDVQNKQALAKALLANQTPAQNPLGVIANLLSGAASGNLNKQAASEAQQGTTDANTALANALIGGPQAMSSDPAALISAESNPFASQAGTATANDVLKNQQELNKPIPISSFDSGLFTPATGQFNSTVGMGSGAGSPQDIANNIMSGNGTMADLGNLSRPMASAVMGILSASGYGTAQNRADFHGALAKETALNGVKGTGMQQALNNAPPLLDNIDKLADQWNSTVPVPLNQFNLDNAKKGYYGQDKAQLATQLESQITDIGADLGQIYKGGNSPTDKALEQGATQLDSGWSTATIHAMTNQIRQNIQQRMQGRQESAQGMNLQGGTNQFAQGPAQGQPLPALPGAQTSAPVDYTTYFGAQ